jgi:hypothetical protein
MFGVVISNRFGATRCDGGTAAVSKILKGPVAPKIPKGSGDQESAKLSGGTQRDKVIREHELEMS